MDWAFGAPAWPASAPAIARAHKTTRADTRVGFTPHSIRQLAREPERLLLELKSGLLDEACADAHLGPQQQRVMAWQGESPAAIASVSRLPWNTPADGRRAAARELGGTCSSLGVDTDVAASSEAWGWRQHGGLHSAASACAECAHRRAENDWLRDRCHALERQLSSGAQPPPFGSSLPPWSSYSAPTPTWAATPAVAARPGSVRRRQSARPRPQPATGSQRWVG